MDLPSPTSLLGAAADLAGRYAELEAGLRRAIDPLTGRICPRCTNLCCRSQYCRKTGENPWYRFVNLLAGGFRVPADWASRRDPFGLGPRGCEIRAGRYAFCYSYNCSKLRNALPDAEERAAFQELSDLMLSPNRLPRGRFLHELCREEDLTPEDLASISRDLEKACMRLAELSARVGSFDPTPHNAGRQDDRRDSP